ncbi:MAG: serine/threonine-protein kinase [Myxococcota bacterium]
MGGPGESIDRIGRYRVLRALGHGTSATVFAAVDETSGRSVAIKLLKLDHSGPATSTRKQLRMVRESEALIKSAHPNVVRIFEVGLVDQRTFIAMELVDGPDLYRWLEIPRAPADILQVFLQCAQGLAAAHRAGIVHRDFKPANVMLRSDGTAVVSDFGLARLETQEHSDGGALAMPLTRSGAVLGTPRYMAPEQFEAGPVDARTDQFAWAVALYEALYRRHPFLRELKPETPPVIAYSSALAQGTAIAPALPPPGTEAVWPILARALSMDPSQRFNSMEELSDKLTEALERPKRERTWFFASSALSSVLVLVGIAVAVQGALGPTACRAKVTKLVDTARQGGVVDAFLTRPALTGVWEALTDQLNHLDQWWLEARTQVCRARDTEESKAALECLVDQRRALERILARGGELPPLAVAGLISALEVGDCRAPAEPGPPLAQALRRGDPGALGALLEALAPGSPKLEQPSALPGDPARLAAVALILFAYADKSGSIALLEAAVKAPSADPELSATIALTLVARRLSEARTRLGAQDPKAAEEEVDRLLAALPGTAHAGRAQALIARGFLRLHRGARAAAGEDFGHAEEIAPEQGLKNDAALGRGWCLLNADEPEAARQMLARVFDARAQSAPLKRAEAGYALARAMSAAQVPGAKALLLRCLPDAAQDRELTALISDALAEAE